jgi:hypothetical protein
MASRIGRFLPWQFIVLLGSSCAHPPARFALRDPVWVDADRNPMPGKPEKYFSGLMGDGADQILFRPLSQFFTFPLAQEAANVNSLDEVPDSAWFENRIGFFPMTPADVALGACAGLPPLDPATTGPWNVVVAKPDGANPGFFIKARDGQRYLLKFDGAEQPQRATAADVVGSKLYHAAGYHSPCNQTVYFPQSVLRMDPAATRTNQYGEVVAMTNGDVDTVLGAAYRRKDGWLRASASRFLPGTPIGPFRYEGTRADDPNDVVAHQDRRELRGGRLFAAWLNHFDTREQNSLDLWVNDRGRGYLRHYYIDWGDCLGSAWAWDAVSRRLGYSGYFDYDQILVDLLSLGMVRRPWNVVRPSSEYQTFGYFSPDQFVASEWRGGYRNPAFERMTLRDALWAVRILSRFSDADVAAAVSSGHLDDPRAEQALVRALTDRRKRILDEYLHEGSSLDRFVVVRRTAGDPVQSLCFEDRAVATGVTDPAQIVYRVRAFGGASLERILGWLQFRPDLAHPHRSCIVLPIGHVRPHDLAGAAAPPDAPLRYQVIEIQTTQQTTNVGTTSVRLHFYDLGPQAGYRLVGIERPEHPRRFGVE